MQGIRKMCKFKNFFAKVKPQPMVVLIQEHHFGFVDCMTKTHQLDFKGGASMWNNATYSLKGGRYQCGT
jgi:hypothetical protein